MPLRDLSMLTAWSFGLCFDCRLWGRERTQEDAVIRACLVVLRWLWIQAGDGVSERMLYKFGSFVVRFAGC